MTTHSSLLNTSQHDWFEYYLVLLITEDQSMVSLKFMEELWTVNIWGRTGQVPKRWLDPALKWLYSKGTSEEKQSQTRQNIYRVGSGYSGLNVSWNRWGLNGLLKTVWELSSWLHSFWQAMRWGCESLPRWVDKGDRSIGDWCLGKIVTEWQIFHFL